MSATWGGAGALLAAFATCCMLILILSSDSTKIQLLPKFACTDSSICSKYALLRAGPTTNSGGERSKSSESSSRILQASGNQTTRSVQHQAPDLQPGSIVHLSTEQGNLPLFVDGRPDNSGYIPVHAFREGLRYDGFITIGMKGSELQYPPPSLLHAGQQGRDRQRMAKIRGRLEGASGEAVKGELALESSASRPRRQQQTKHVQRAAAQTPSAAAAAQAAHASKPSPVLGQTSQQHKQLKRVQRRSEGSQAVTVKKASVIKGYFDMSNDHFASVNLKPSACSSGAMSPSCGTSSFACSAHLHLHVEVFCPPYTAPEHGSVTYRGKEYRSHTGSEEAGRHYLTINGHRYPLAAAGDIPSCEQVKIHCDPHYELDGREGAFRDPYCLQSGEWEKGQSCVRIACEPYRPPLNGYVFPTGQVFAGESVAIKCDPGFMPHFGEEHAKENPQCLDTRAYELGVTCVPIMCPAYVAPEHASVTPSGPVQVGERVAIVCNRGYRARIYNDLHPTLWPTFGETANRMPDDLVGTATPMCLETTKYEEGITCVPLPVQCPAYQAPNHGSVWYELDEYRIASPSGLEGWPRTDSLFITCDEHYQLSDGGRQTIRCLRTGEWEQGKTCEPIMCDSFQAPAHSTFNGPRTRVLAGTQVFVSCDEGYQASGVSRGLTASPKCLDSGYFEEAIKCVPVKRNEEERPAEPRQREEEREEDPAPQRESQELQEEKGKDAGYTVHDYSPNIFDQEPR
ncbi:hypothetical protein GUITHDRAFT_137535 [Guillardia theta CCMP2712]|uniref:Sushi domain-containing protein n=1 Tax=Guillardia theta (strain CCMP2712) TaxID=905079 RepID=L1JFU1_GUITC|nr:hypothetical protein GUITHDRAFT_137535 [Guillardia theta CCMP2712]EKX47356.1 hypothetical protein GUITHDRAFT_137535 [Guillardia theta CCMP2712]|eukprot:XP_005834336.1 hypothetical protein GUITHDRAFT_137535 [Guillardia theta CCMP2712]